MINLDDNINGKFIEILGRKGLPLALISLIFNLANIPEDDNLNLKFLNSSSKLNLLNNSILYHLIVNCCISMNFKCFL